MFKINKLNDTTDEKVVINSSKQEVYKVGNGVIDYNLLLDFDITGKIGNDTYSFGFDLSCKPSDFLDNDVLDYKKDNLHIGETYFNFNDENGVEPSELNIKFTRYIKNKFIVYIEFVTDDYYSSVIEFTFDIDDYLIDLEGGSK